ncbi:MAG: VanW family protein, partial [Nocardioidaceae bacterium]
AFVVAIVVVFAGLYFVGYAVAGDKVPSGTSVAGVDIGGMARDEAATKLRRALQPRLTSPVTVAYDGKTFRITPSSAGVAFDLTATLDSVMGGSNWDPRHMLHVVLGGSAMDPVIRVNHTRLDSTLGRIAPALLVRPVDGGVTFVAGQPSATAAHVGRSLNVSGTARRLQHAIAAGTQRIRVAVAANPPRVDSRAVTRFIDDVAMPAVGSPVSLLVGGLRITLPPSVFAVTLRARVVEGKLRLGAFPAGLYARTRPYLRMLPHQPANAGFVFRQGRPIVTPSHAGRIVAQRDLADAVLRAVQRRGGHRAARVSLQRAGPTFTTARAKKMQIKARLGAASVTVGTTTSAAALRAVARSLDATLVKPGERFSFNQVVGRQDRPASVAAASSLYAAALSAGMTGFVSTPNRYYSTRFAVGRDAYVAPPTYDLSFVDSTPYGLLLHAWVSGAGDSLAVHLELWGTRYRSVALTTSPRIRVVPAGVRREGGATCTPQPGSVGFDIQVRRTLSRDGKVVGRDSRISHYEPRPAVVCGR